MELLVTAYEFLHVWSMVNNALWKYRSSPDLQKRVKVQKKKKWSKLLLIRHDCIYLPSLCFQWHWCNRSASQKHLKGSSWKVRCRQGLLWHSSPSHTWHLLFLHWQSLPLSFLAYACIYAVLSAVLFWGTDTGYYKTLLRLFSQGARLSCQRGSAQTVMLLNVEAQPLPVNACAEKSWLQISLIYWQCTIADKRINTYALFVKSCSWRSKLLLSCVKADIKHGN